MALTFLVKSKFSLYYYYYYYYISKYILLNKLLLYYDYISFLVFLRFFFLKLRIALFFSVPCSLIYPLLFLLNAPLDLLYTLKNLSPNSFTSLVICCHSFLFFPFILHFGIQILLLPSLFPPGLLHIVNFGPQPSPVWILSPWSCASCFIPLSFWSNPSYMKTQI